MEYQPLFVAFMVAVVSGLLGVILLLKDIKQKLSIEPDKRKRRNKNPLDCCPCELSRMQYEPNFIPGTVTIHNPEHPANESTGNNSDK